MANKKRLIDADRRTIATALKVAHDSLFTPGEYEHSICGKAALLLERDVVEVVHGYWIDSYSADHLGRIIEHSIDCSVCDSVFKDDSREVVKRWKERFKVCPFCGAVMDGGNEDG